VNTAEHRTHAPHLRWAGWLAALAAFTGSALAGGPNSIPVSPAAPLLSSTTGLDPCIENVLSMPLTLADAVSRALCANPKTRGAWASIKLTAAEVSTAQESYLPNLSATGALEESNTHTKINDDPSLDTEAHNHYPAGSVSLSWVLYDFGERGNRLDAARQLLTAAQANLDLNLQQVFLRAAADYYNAQAAQATWDAARQIEDLTARSFGAAHARTQRGVSALSDELQAQTAHVQAVLVRVRADGDLKARRGALAVDMGLAPDATLIIPPPDLSIAVRTDFNESVHQLIDEAKRSHPSVIQAESELAAARADERAARAQGYPTISVLGGLSRSNEPLSPSLGSPTVPGSVSNEVIGIQISVPISDPLWKRGLIAQAHAQVQIQQEALYGTEQQVAADVWTSYTALQTDTDTLSDSLTLLESARHSLDAAQHRYEGGAGNILELLTAQAAYANAQQLRIQSLADWRIARLALGADLGRLGLWAFEGTR
jgi:outer membrane protein